MARTRRSRRPTTSTLPAPERTLLDVAHAAEEVADVSAATREAVHETTRSFRDLKAGLRRELRPTKAPRARRRRATRPERAAGRVERIASSVGTAARRAVHAPAAVAAKATRAEHRFVKDASVAGIQFAIAAFFGLAAFAVLTLLLIVGLAALVGIPWALAIVGVAYVIVATVAGVWGARKTVAAKEDVTEGLEQVSEGAKSEARGIVQPIQRAWRA